MCASYGRRSVRHARSRRLAAAEHFRRNGGGEGGAYEVVDGRKVRYVHPFRALFHPRAGRVDKEQGADDGRCLRRLFPGLQSGSNGRKGVGAAGEEGRHEVHGPHRQTS